MHLPCDVVISKESIGVSRGFFLSSCATTGSAMLLVWSSVITVNELPSRQEQHSFMWSVTSSQLAGSKLQVSLKLKHEVLPS